MAEMIEDGTGQGYRAKVTKDNLLETNAVVEQNYAFVSRTKSRAFVAASQAITTDGTANDVFMCTNPSSTFELVLVQIDISCTTDATILIELNQAYSSGGTGITPTNLNRSSTRASVASDDDVFYGDDITLSGTALLYSQFVNPANTPFREEFLDAIILGQDDSINVNINAASGTAYVSLKFYEVDV